MNILGSVEIKGRKVHITDESPQEWHKFVGLDWNKPDSDIVAGRRIERTLEKVQKFLSTCTPPIEESTEGLTDSHPWHKVIGDDWQIDAARCFYLMAAKELNIEPPEDAKFFRKAAADEKVAFRTKQDALGVNTRDGVIWIREDRAGSGFIETVAHEMYHQLTADEPPALAYGKQFAARFGKIPCWAKLYFFPYVWEEEFCFYKTRIEAPRGSYLVNLRDGWIYEKEWGGWSKVRSLKILNGGQ